MRGGNVVDPLRSLFDPEVTPSRFLTRDDCRALGTRIFGMCVGEGKTTLTIQSQWSRTVRWARNVVNTSADVQNTSVMVTRAVNGADSHGIVETNVLEDAELRAIVQRAESMTQLYPQDPEQYPIAYPNTPSDIHPVSDPPIWSDRTDTLEADVQAATAEALIAPVDAAGLLATGTTIVSAHGQSTLTAYHHEPFLFRYAPYTAAQYSITVRDPDGTASGWAGIDVNDWDRIDPMTLTQRAIEKCVTSRNPVAIEPGRYTVILEPQAVCDLIAPLVERGLDRIQAELGQGPFADVPGRSKIGARVVDPRITISADPMDPELGFVPFDGSGEPYLDTQWIEHGILRALSYSRIYALQRLGKDWALPNSKAFRMSGGTTSVEEMIAKTARGVLVTRFNNLVVIDDRSLLSTGTTRDGLWLIENGKISKSLKNFRFTESPLFALNNVELLGVPRRVFRPDAPAVCPPITVKDFSFTGLADAV